MQILPSRARPERVYSKSMRVTLMDVYMFLICAFPLATTLFAEGIVNKVMFAMMVGLQVSQILMNPLKKSSCLCLFIMAANFCLVAANTHFPLYAINMLFYYPFFLMYTYFVCDNRALLMNWFCKHQKLIRGVLWLWTVLVFISIFLPGSYHAKEGGKLYFGSFCKTIFRLGPAAIFIQILGVISMVYFKRRTDIMFQFLPLFCAYMGSSRTYLVICVLVFVVAWYIFCIQRRTFWASIIPLVVIIIWLVGQTAIGDKIDTTMDEENYGDFMSRFTSGRSVIWENIFQDWNTQPLFNKLFGVDINYSFYITGLWAHNDFIEILGSFGIMGVIHYVYAVIYMLRVGYGRVRVPVLLSVCVFIVWLFNAFFNMHYVYFCAMLALPFLVFALRDYSQEKFGAYGSECLTVQYNQKTEG